MLRLAAGAAAAAALLLSGMVFASARGFVPRRLLTDQADLAPPPATTNPETTLVGSEPVIGVQCAFAPTPPGAVCTFLLADPSGNLVNPSVAVRVPRRWLAGFPHATQPDNLRVVAALVHTPYAPAGGSGMDSLAVSVDPAFAARLSAAGVSPRQLLRWLYRNVPPRSRPPWVGGTAPPA